MLRFTAENYDVDAICDALLNGDGVVAISGLYSDDVVAEARRIIMDHSDADDQKPTHFQGAAAEDGKLNLQRRVWNLLAKGDVYDEMASHPVLMDILRKWLGTEFIMGSLAANRILPGGPGQEPHIDYPYWDFHAPETHPMGLNGSFPMNAQVSIILDPFTEESGATGYVAGSQKELRYPTEADGFYDKCSQMTGNVGDVVLFYGAMWHCAMPNKSTHDRSAVLINYLPKWVKPIEDMHIGLSDGFFDGATPELRQLMGFNYAYPKALDESVGGNEEGRK